MAISAQWIGWKFKIPVIVILISSGTLFGPILSIIKPRMILGPIINPMIELAVSIVLFEGAMSLKVHEFKKASKGLTRLFSVAVILNWSIGAILGKYLAHLTWTTSLLISGILVVTGPTVIIPALREAKLASRTSNYLKWEGIINDPIGAILAALVLQFYFRPQSEIIFFSILKIILIPFIFSTLTRFLFIKASQRALVPEYLKTPFFIGVVIILFIISELIQAGSGLLTSTLLGFFIGNLNISSIKELKRFAESIAIIMVPIIFIILSASINLQVWNELTWQHYVLIFSFSFLIRPIAIYISTIKSEMRLNEKILVGMYGPRGIVAASIAGVIGEQMLEEGLIEGRFVVPIIFSVILVTVIVHGLWLKPLSKFLNLTNIGEHGIVIVGASDWSIQLARFIKELKFPVLITDTSWYQLAQARYQGIETHYGQILEDLELGEPDLSEYNYLFAFTEDDNYNLLICNKLKHLFGSEHVYKLPAAKDEYTINHNLTKKEFCYLSDSNDAFYENLMKKSHLGWHFDSITFSSDYNYEKFYNDQKYFNITILMIIRQNNRIELFSINNPLKPNIGDIVIFYRN